MGEVDKITELINKYTMELRDHYNTKIRINTEENYSLESYSPYEDGVNDAYINAKEQFIDELRELKDFYIDEK